jgi:hypothetical protein
MPRADASFIQPTLLSATVHTTLTTSPAAGSKWIIRHIHFENTDSTARTVRLSIGADTVTTRIVADETVAANSSLDKYGIWEVPASTIIEGSASVVSVVNVTLSGTLNTP